MKILVVDDDPVVLKSCRRVLEEEGFLVTLAGSVKEALEKLVGQSFSLLLVDLKMPEEDGLFLMERLREKRIDSPILVMSGYPTEETISRSKAFGARHFIAKPFTPDELLEAIHKVSEGGTK